MMDICLRPYCCWFSDCCCCLTVSKWKSITHINRLSSHPQETGNAPDKLLPDELLTAWCSVTNKEMC